MANSVVHFEIFASNVERARKFYERVFGWQFEAAGPPDFYLFATGPETDPGFDARPAREARGAGSARLAERVSLHDPRALDQGQHGGRRSRGRQVAFAGRRHSGGRQDRRGRRHRGQRFCLGEYLPSQRWPWSRAGCHERRATHGPPTGLARRAALFRRRLAQGGRIPRHSHEQDQLALISQSAAVVETDAVYVVHPLLKALWIPAGVEHSVYSPRPFSLHSLYFRRTACARTPSRRCSGSMRWRASSCCSSARRRGRRNATHATGTRWRCSRSARRRRQPSRSRCRGRRASARASSPIISRAGPTTAERSSSSPPRSAARACARSSACSSTRRA